jgi:hypothetical protein
VPKSISFSFLQHKCFLFLFLHFRTYSLFSLKKSEFRCTRNQSNFNQRQSKPTLFDQRQSTNGIRHTFFCRILKSQKIKKSPNFDNCSNLFFYDAQQLSPASYLGGNVASGPIAYAACMTVCTAGCIATGILLPFLVPDCIAACALACAPAALAPTPWSVCPHYFSF